MEIKEALTLNKLIRQEVRELEKDLVYESDYQNRAYIQGQIVGMYKAMTLILERSKNE